MPTLAQVRRESRSHFLKFFDGKSEPGEHAERTLAHGLVQLAHGNLDTQSAAAMQNLELNSAPELGREIGVSIEANETRAQLAKRIGFALQTDSNTEERREILTQAFDRIGAKDAVTRQRVDQYERVRKAIVHGVAAAAREFIQPARFTEDQLTPPDDVLRAIAKRAYQRAIGARPARDVTAFDAPEPNVEADALEYALKEAMNAVADRGHVTKKHGILLRRLNLERARMVSDELREKQAEHWNFEVEETINRKGNHAQDAAAQAISEHYGRLKDIARHLKVEREARMRVFRHLEREFGDGPDEAGAT